MVIILSNFFTNVINNFLIAFGIVIGASIFAGIGAIVTDNPPLRAMINLAASIKIWAMATALGGTFSSFVVIDRGLFEGELRSIIKQIIYIFVALSGANAGYGFIRLIQGCNEIWRN